MKLYIISEYIVPPQKKMVRFFKAYSWVWTSIILKFLKYNKRNEKWSFHIAIMLTLAL